MFVVMARITAQPDGKPITQSFGLSLCLLKRNGTKLENHFLFNFRNHYFLISPQLFFTVLSFSLLCTPLRSELFPFLLNSCLHEDMILLWDYHKLCVSSALYPMLPMLVVCKQNDGNSKLIISVFFLLFHPLLLAIIHPPTHSSCTGIIKKSSQVQFMLSMSWTSRRSRTMIWSLEQQIACRAYTRRYRYRLRSQVRLLKPTPMARLFIISNLLPFFPHQMLMTVRQHSRKIITTSRSRNRRPLDR